jgi:AcrR family transcriptional regulator
MSARLSPPFVAADASDRAASARERLLAAATRLFAEKGYSATSTREICQAAQANVAAIHYHFGGKEGLYREVVLAPIHDLLARAEGFADPALSLPEALRRLLGAFVHACAPDADERAAQMHRLHLREMVEPSAGYAEAVSQQVRPHHEALTRLLARHIGLAEPDRDVQQLGFAIVAMAQDCSMSREFMRQLAPDLLHGADAADRLLERLVDWGCALVAHERRRRQNNR